MYILEFIKIQSVKYIMNLIYVCLRVTKQEIGLIVKIVLVEGCSS